MSDHNQYSSEMISRFVKGELSDEESFRIMKQMKEDPLLYEEVRLTEAIMRVETNRFIQSLSTSPEQEYANRVTRPLKKSESPSAPFYRQTWFAAAAVITILMGAGWVWLTMFATEKTTLTATVPVRHSVDGTLGWGRDAPDAGQVITIVTREKGGILRYQYDGDTLKIFTPGSLKALSGKEALYLVDDLKNRQLVLVMEGKKYPVETGRTDETPLIEEPVSLP